MRKGGRPGTSNWMKDRLRYSPSRCMRQLFHLARAWSATALAPYLYFQVGREQGQLSSVDNLLLGLEETLKRIGGPERMGNQKSFRPRPDKLVWTHLEPLLRQDGAAAGLVCAGHQVDRHVQARDVAAEVFVHFIEDEDRFGHRSSFVTALAAKAKQVTRERITGQHRGDLGAQAIEAGDVVVGQDEIVAPPRERSQEVLAAVDPLIEAASALGAGLDWKTSLQELSAEHGLGVPEYVIEDDGPDHEKTFTAQVQVGDEMYGHGTGRSKKEAEQGAAETAYREIKAAHADGGPAPRSEPAPAVAPAASGSDA